VKAATPLYVRILGSDANCNGTVDVNDSVPVRPNCAKRTVEAATNIVDAGGTVFVRAGTYNTEAFPISIAKSLTLTGDGSATTIIDQVAHSANVINVSGNYSVNISGFTIRHGDTGIAYSNSAHGTISNNIVWSNDVFGINFESSSYGTISSNTVYGNPNDDGINVDYPAYGTISNNTVYDNGNDGIDINDTAGSYSSNVTVNANTVYNNVGNGIELYYCTNTVVITNNVIYNTSGQDHGIENDFADVVITNNTIVGHSGASRSGIDNDNDSDTVVTNNIITGNTYGIRCVDGASSSVNTYNDVWSNTTNYSGTAAGAGSISSDPRYTGGTNYHLTCSPLSPAIDAGTSTGAPAADRDGTARPQGLLYDMGAYETTCATYTVTANANGNGTGNVASNVGGINYNYPAFNTGTTSSLAPGTNVVLTASAGTGSTAAWNDCVAAGGAVAGNGTATATCTFSSLNGSKTVTATFTLNTYTVTANANGNGTGNVASNVGGINYNYPANNTGTTSTLNYGTNVVLTATAGTGSTVSWNDCVAAGGTAAGNGTGTATCTFSSLDGAKTVAATFTLDQFTVTANANGNGTGNVSSNVGGINYNYPANNTGTSSAINYGTNVVLTAAAGIGSTAAWNDCVGAGGAVAGNGTATATCTFSSLNGNKTVTATFTLNTYALTVTIVGNGSVTSNPAGINCGSDCVEVYNYGTIVTLTATPTAISSFTGWSGACTGTALTCILTIDAAKNVTATFGLKQANKKVQLPSLLPMALNNMASAKTLLTQANELLSQAKAKGKDTGTCENLIREATELLAKANTVRTNPVYANNLALQSIAKLKQAIDCLKALVG